MISEEKIIDLYESDMQLVTIYHLIVYGKSCGICKYHFEVWSLRVRLALIIFTNLFYYSAYFYYYSCVPLHFLILFMSHTVLFQLTFTFIYNTFSKKFSVSVK